MLAVLPEIMKKIDAQTIAEGIPAKALMNRAALAVYDTVKRCISSRDSIVILCGKGNNGGDGYALALLLKKDCETVCCINTLSELPASPEAESFYQEYLAANGVIYENNEEAITAIQHADILVDAIFGTGFSGEIHKVSAIYNLIESANENLTAMRIAIDAPSGISCTNGRVEGIAFCADITVTLAKAKPGLYLILQKPIAAKLLSRISASPKKL